MASKQDFSDLIKMDEKALFLAVGEELRPAGFALDRRDDKEKERDGRAWFERNTQALREKVCGDDRVKVILANEQAFGRVELVTAIADLISLIVTGVSPMLVAVIIVKRGLAEFCASVA